MMGSLESFIKDLFNISDNMVHYFIPILLLLVTVIIFFLFRFIIYKILNTYLKRRKITSSYKEEAKKLFLKVQKKMIPVFIILLLYFIIYPLIYNLEIASYFNYIFLTAIILSLIQFCISIVDFIMQARFLEHISSNLTKKNINTISFILRLLIWLIGIIIILNQFGLKITNLLAGLGISGIIIALAAQSLFSDLFSYASIILDKPFEIDDFISIEDFTGKVEHIGLKSTRLRSIDGELVVIPNSSLTSIKLRNFKQIVKRRVVLKLKFTISNGYEKIGEVNEVISSILKNREKIEFERCNLADISNQVALFYVVYYILAPDFIEFVNIQHDINLEILRKIEEKKIAFSSDVVNIDYVKHDKRERQA